MEVLSEKAKFLIDHCFLPPKLPEKSDDESGADFLLGEFHDVAQMFLRQLQPEERRHWAPIAKSIGHWRAVYSNGNMCETNLFSAVLAMAQRSVLLIFVQAQNAAIMLTKKDHTTKFKAWEMSAKQEDVLAADNALIRQFPARAVEIHEEVMIHMSCNWQFRKSLKLLMMQAACRPRAPAKMC